MASKEASGPVLEPDASDVLLCALILYPWVLLIMRESRSTINRLIQGIQAMCE